LVKYSVNSVTIPDTLDFAGESVPLNYFDVKEGLDKEIHVNTYFHSQTILLIKRTSRFFPEIEKILKEEDVPDDFKYLAAIESGLQNVVSPSRAAGFWQFLKKTGLDYGLEISDEVDERYHLEKATRAACRYLKDAYAKLGSWTLAAASYNAGIKALQNCIDTQKQHSYYDLSLNEETARYIYRILAMKLIITNPENFGFHIEKKDMYSPLPFREIVIDSTINDLAQFAIQQGSSYKMLTIMNPWLRKNSLTIKTPKSYTVRILTLDQRTQMQKINAK
jgi:hypothetical protein